MKFARFLVLSAMIGVVPVLSLQAVGQQEIDPEHFDQAELAKAAKPAMKPNAGPRAKAAKRQRKSVVEAPHSWPIAASAHQAKAESHGSNLARVN
jgi:hypothetical protein